MAEAHQRLALLSPYGVGASDAESIGRALAQACGAGDVAAVILRLAPADERGLVNLIKGVAPSVQDTGAALVVTCPGLPGDLTSIATRGGADGVHLDKADGALLRGLRGRLSEGRILGVGGLGSRHEAMAAGEAGVDYLMFGSLEADGNAPDPRDVSEQAAWWAEIFETPCIAVACAQDDVAGLVRTGAEFIGLESAIWLPAPERVAAVQVALDRRVGA